MSRLTAPADHFSSVSASYAACRPRYPRELFAFVASIAPVRGRAWDCGAGTGQAPLESDTVDLIAVAQALHWFDHASFYAEVRRVATRDAAIAAWTYAAPRMEGAAGAVLHRFMFEHVGPYWPPERKFVGDEYEWPVIMLAGRVHGVVAAASAH